MRIVYFALSALLFSAAAITPVKAAAPQADESGAEIEKESYFRPGIAPVFAPAGYDLTIVYFIDYQCPSCRQYTPDVARVLAEDRKVRVIYRDTPIISELSTVAARAAIASAFQGRHAAFHHALMMSKGRLTEESIRAAADKAKVDWPRLQRDLKARGEAIDGQIGRNIELAVTIGILGTPAFIIGERQSNGALDYKGLKAEIADARAAAGPAIRESSAAEQRPDEIADPSPDRKSEAAKSEPKAIFAPSVSRPVTPVAKTQSDAGTSPGTNVSAILAIVAAIAAIGGGWWWKRRRRDRQPGHQQGLEQS